MSLYKTTLGGTNRQPVSDVPLSEPFEAVLQRLGDVTLDRAFRNAQGICNFALGETVDPVQQENMAIDWGQFIERSQAALQALAGIDGGFWAGCFRIERIQIDFMLKSVVAFFLCDAAIRRHIGSHAIEIGTGIFQRALVCILKDTKIGILNDIGSLFAADSLPCKGVQLTGMQ